MTFTKAAVRFSRTGRKALLLEGAQGPVGLCPSRGGGSREVGTERSPRPSLHPEGEKQLKDTQEQSWARGSRLCGQHAEAFSFLLEPTALAQLENTEEAPKQAPEQVGLALHLPERSSDKDTESKSAGVDFQSGPP